MLFVRPCCSVSLPRNTLTEYLPDHQPHSWGEEIDFRFSVLHPHVGYRHFKEGISKLKQVTGREHRDVQRYIVGTAPKEFVVAICALIDFRYLALSLMLMLIWAKVIG